MRQGGDAEGKAEDEGKTAGALTTKMINDIAMVRELKADAADAAQWSIRLIPAEESSMTTLVSGRPQP